MTHENPRLTLVAVTASALMVLFVAHSSAGGPERRDVPPVSQRKPAPSFMGTSSTGTPVGLDGYRGRVVLLDFWATWCTGCKLEIPWYIDFQKKYARAGLTSVGVAMDDENWTVVKPYLAAHPIGYPVIVNTPDVAGKYGVVNLPVTVLIDRHGRIADSHLGVVDRAAWETEIRALLREK